jgi:hypothetical protein
MNSLASKVVYWHLKLNDQFSLRVVPVLDEITTKADTQITSIHTRIVEKVAEIMQTDILHDGQFHRQ